jgi:hypothetical protein
VAELHEDWYSDFQLGELGKLVNQVRGLSGALVEIGCWEGKSTMRIAEMCAPQKLHAVDHWLGNVDEGENHASVVALRERDVYGTFLENMSGYPNVEPHRTSGEDFLSNWTGPMKFAHVDVGHTFEVTSAMIELLLPHMVLGGIICGDDYLTSHIGRFDLSGGVQRAVSELLPHHSVVGNFWYWHNQGVRTKMRIFNYAPASAS